MRKIAICLLMFGCGSSAQVDQGQSLQTQQSAEDSDYPVLRPWHAIVVEAQEQMRPIGGSDNDWQTLTTHIRGLVQVVSNGEKPELRFQPCSLALPEIAGIQPVLPASTVQAVAPVSVVGQWTKVDDHFELSTPEWSTMTFGATLENPLTDALPHNKNDARVVDLDGDGKPGVTMKASIGRLYMVMRGMTKLNGVYNPETGGLAGTAEYKRDFYVFGDNVFGIAKKKVDDTEANSEMRPAPTTGSLTPLTVEAPTCANVL